MAQLFRPFRAGQIAQHAALRFFHRVEHVSDMMNHIEMHRARFAGGEQKGGLLSDLTP